MLTKSQEQLGIIEHAKIFSTNTSGCTGVHFNKASDKYEAYIWDNYKKINLGHFFDRDLAIAARREAELTYNYHENHGRGCITKTPVV